MNEPRDDRTPAWPQEPERRLTGIVLPSFDDPSDAPDEFERDRRSRAAAQPSTYTPALPTAAGTADDDAPFGARPVSGRPVPLVPSGPPPAWPPVEPASTGLGAPGFDPLTDDLPGFPSHRTPTLPAEEADDQVRDYALAAEPRARREFPRYVAGEYVPPADPVAAAPRTWATDFDPLTAPVEMLDAHLNGVAPRPATPAPPPAPLATPAPAPAPAPAPGPPAAEPVAARQQPTTERATGWQKPTTELPTAWPQPATELAAARQPRPEVAAAPVEARERTPYVEAPTGPPPPPPRPSAGLREPATMDAVTAQLPTVPPPARPAPAASAPPPTSAPAPLAPAPAAAPGSAPGSGSAAGSAPAAVGAFPGEGATAVQPQDPRRGVPFDAVPHPAFPDATARTFRILPIAADLMPLEITESRRVHRIRRLVISGVALVALLVAGWYGVEVRAHSNAQGDLQSAVDMKDTLNRQKRQRYNGLTKTQKDSSTIENQLKKVMADDLSWSRLLTSLRSAAPGGGVTVTGITGALSQAAAQDSASTGVVGSVTLTGTAPSKAAVAQYVDNLKQVPGIANPFPTDATQDGNVVTFTIKLDITTAALGGRFTKASAAPSAGPSGGK